MEPLRMDPDIYGWDHMEDGIEYPTQERDNAAESRAATTITPTSAAAPPHREQAEDTVSVKAKARQLDASVVALGAKSKAGGVDYGIDSVLASGYNPACCPGYFPGYVSSYRRQGHACMPHCPPGFRFSALWDACIPVAPALCHASPCAAPVMSGCGCAKQYPTHHKNGYGTVSNCYYPGANSTCAPGYTRVGDKCVWTKW
ncbi:MAG: hypothetical protein LBB86_06145 [Oscillospiraceae bacterium]|nr:hypothetical protein [Oscillospiraceae bacterium]